MISIGKSSNIEKYEDSLVIVDVERDNSNDNRISKCVIYRLGKDKNGIEYWIKCNDENQEKIVNLINKKWTVRTGCVKSGAIDIGADVETELRVSENGDKYPLSKMGRS
uniref:hypothetical protein n=1 Tax=Novacetimonas labruscae TaxID=3229898 RepID=UPI003B5A01A5